MALPSISAPEYECELPSSGEIIKYRPFLVKEQKLLYMALEGQNDREIANSILNLLESCILTPNIDVKNLPSFDIEYVFLQLRAKSVGEVITLKVGHQDQSECSHMTEVSINLDDIKIVNMDKERSDKIQLNDGVGMVLRYPTLTDALNASSAGTESEKLFSLVQSCIKNIYDQEKVYEEFDPNELKDFIESMNVEQFTKVMKYFGDIPTVEYEVSWTCEKCGKEDSMKLTGLKSFFS